MRKGFKKFLAIAAASVMAAGALPLAACGTNFVTPEGAPPADAEVVSNGGFVVGKGDYYYFINGVESYTSDNTYGTPVKGALMRIKKADLHAKENTAEIVVPSLMVAGYYEAGIYIYGDRVYYATPNDVPDTSGEVLTSYLDFKSAKLDGTDIQSYFSLDTNTVPYRFVEAGEEGNKSVYVLYVTSNDLYSYNTSTKEKTLLADNTTGYAFNKRDLTDPTVYYTMSVSDHLDSDKESTPVSYNQLYRVGADATEAPYEYSWDMDYINENLDGEIPYTNLGTIVLDGRSPSDPKTQFNHSATEPAEGVGYSYSIRSYENGGVYVTKKDAQGGGGTVGSGEELYFIDETRLSASWDSVKANEEESGALTKIAVPSDYTAKATSSALLYRDEQGAHHYLYLNGSTIYRADVSTSGRILTEQPIAYEVSGATLVSVDLDSHETYDYLYFTRSNGAGRSVERAVINGDPIYYENLPYGDNDNTPYMPVKVLDIEHSDSWYPFELIGTDLFFSDADNTVASTSYRYISAVSLANGQGELMDNAELKAFTDKYDSLMSADAKVGLFEKLADSKMNYSKLSKALKYYFLTGSTAAFEDNLAEAKDNGKKDTFLYTQTEQDAFYAFNNNEGYTDENGKVLFKETDYKDGNEDYRTYSYFVTRIGQMTDADKEAQEEYWRGYLARDVVEEEESASGLPAWAWALIGVGIAAVVILAIVLVLLAVRKKKAGGATPAAEKMKVDTTDDRSVDVYSDETEPAEMPAEEPTETSVEEPAEETPAETPAEIPAEQPADGGKE